MPQTMSGALARAKARVGKANKVGYCLEECVVNIYQIPGPWRWGGNGSPWALNFWLAAVAHGKVVKTSNPADVPAGAMVFWDTHYGHVAIGAGGGYVYSTDRPVNGKWGHVTIASINAAWGKHLLGYILVTGDGVDLRDKATPADTPPPTTPATSFSLHIGTLNVCRNRITTTGKTWKAPSGLTISDVQKGKAWSERVKLIPSIRKALAVSILCTNESGQYVDGNLVDAQLGSVWANVLHGDAGDLTNAIHYDKTKRKAVASGSYTTAGKTHNSATWVLFEDIATSIRFLLVSTHLINKKGGSDAERKAQTAALIAGGEKVAAAHGGVPIVFTGDFNSDKDDADDGPGKAFAAAGGYHEVDVAAKTSTNGDKATTNELGAFHTGRRLDRAWVSSSISVSWVTTAYGAPATDHNGVGFLLKIPA